jgi:hypothetical protein
MQASLRIVCRTVQFISLTATLGNKLCSGAWRQTLLRPQEFHACCISDSVDASAAKPSINPHTQVIPLAAA